MLVLILLLVCHELDVNARMLLYVHTAMLVLILLLVCHELDFNARMLLCVCPQAMLLVHMWCTGRATCREVDFNRELDFNAHTLLYV